MRYLYKYRYSSYYYMTKLTSHMDSISTRVKSLDIAQGMSDSLMNDDTISNIFSEWDLAQSQGSFSESASQMLSGLDLFASDSDLLLDSHENDFLVISYWLLERAAFYGVRPAFLRSMLQSNFKLSIQQMDEMYPLSVIEKFLSLNTKLINSRRYMLIKELEGSSVDLSKIIRDRIAEIDGILKSLVQGQNFKYYAQISSTWLKSLELLAKLLGKFTNQSAQINIKALNIQNFISVQGSIEDRIKSLVDKGKIPKRYENILITEFSKEFQELYDVDSKTIEYSLQKVS